MTEPSKKTLRTLEQLLQETEHATHYEVLGVHAQSAKAELDQVRRAWALKLHPDRHADHPAATRMMARINAAYDVLTDPKRLARYRAELLSTHEPCANCAGAGAARKQRGFKAVTYIICGHCHGVGMFRKPVTVAVEHRGRK